MGLGSEEGEPQEIIEIKMGKPLFFGGLEGLPQKFISLTLNNEGNPRIKRFEGTNRVIIWGQDKKQRFPWVNWLLVQELPEKVYQRIDGSPVIIDISVPTPEEPDRLIRLNYAGNTGDSRLFRLEVNPKIRDLGKGN